MWIQSLFLKTKALKSKNKTFSYLLSFIAIKHDDPCSAHETLMLQILIVCPRVTQGNAWWPIYKNLVVVRISVLTFMGTAYMSIFQIPFDKKWFTSPGAVGNL